MKIKHATLDKIARHIRKKLAFVETRSRDEMYAAIDEAASHAKSQREAAYLIATEVFDFIDHEDHDRRKINDILSDYEGQWQPNRQ